MNITNIINPRYVTEDHNMIALMVDLDELNLFQVQFNAGPYDMEPYGVDLYNRAVSGEFGEIGPFVPDTTPNGYGFKESIKQELGILEMNKLVFTYPMLFSCIDENDWPNTRVIFLNAKSTNVLDDNQCEIIETNAARFNLPIML